MRTALVLGGGGTLHDDIAALTLPYDGVIACNDAGMVWQGELDAWVSLHPNKFNVWMQRRRENGYAPAKCLIGHNAQPGVPDMKTSAYMFPGMGRSGSSGAFAAKVALIDYGFDRAVLCGIPLTATPHFFGGAAWRSAESFRRGWLEIPQEYLRRMRSMSGWTRVLLGSPKDWECDRSEHVACDHHPAVAAQAADR